LFEMRLVVSHSLGLKFFIFAKVIRLSH
jgi:hypothetical protein